MRLMIFLISILIAQIAAAMPNEVVRPNELLARKLMRHSRLAHDAGRFVPALRSATLADFLSRSKSSEEFLSEKKGSTMSFIESLRSDASDLLRAGEYGEASRIQFLIESIWKVVKADE